jgi:hypothetical protein
LDGSCYSSDFVTCCWLWGWWFWSLTCSPDEGLQVENSGIPRIIRSAAQAGPSTAVDRAPSLVIHLDSDTISNKPSDEDLHLLAISGQKGFGLFA